MTRIVGLFTAVTILAWAAGLFIYPPGFTTRAVVHEMFFITGTLAWGFMAIALVIALRPAWLEKAAGEPIDRLYGMHRTLGIWATVLSVIHYFCKPIGGAFNAVLGAIGLAPAPAGKPVIDRSAMDALELFWADLRPIANDSAIWLTAILVVLAALALMRRIPYPKWLTIHRLFAIVFIGLALHSVRLMDATDFLSPFGWINLAVTVVGLWASVMILLRGVGAEKTIGASIERIEADGSLTLLEVRPEKPLRARPGQFAFLQVPGHEKHPFSIASESADGTLTFAIKGLGDFTNGLGGRLRVGDKLKVEGPWGAFTPDARKENQLWVAAGIGIAPFCAWLESARNGTAPKGTRLLWCVKNRAAEPMLPRVEALARHAGVSLEIFESRGPRMNPKAEIERMRPSGLAFCTGAGLGAELRAAWSAIGGSPEALQCERFEWR